MLSLSELLNTSPGAGGTVGGGTPIGGILTLSSALPTVYTVDGMVFLREGNAVLDGESYYPEAYNLMTPTQSLVVGGDPAGGSTSGSETRVPVPLSDTGLMSFRITSNSNSTNIRYTADGVNWINYSSDIRSIVNVYPYADGRILDIQIGRVYRLNGNTLSAAVSGVTGTTSPLAGDNFAEGNGWYYLDHTTISSGLIYRSADGNTYTGVNLGGTITGVVFIDDYFYILNSNGLFRTSGPETPVKIIVNPSNGNASANSIAYDGSKYLLRSSSDLFESVDGESWTQLPLPPPGINQILDYMDGFIMTGATTYFYKDGVYSDITNTLVGTNGVAKKFGGGVLVTHGNTHLALISPDKPTMILRHTDGTVIRPDKALIHNDLLYYGSTSDGMGCISAPWGIGLNSSPSVNLDEARYMRIK